MGMRDDWVVMGADRVLAGVCGLSVCEGVVCGGQGYQGCAASRLAGADGWVGAAMKIQEILAAMPAWALDGDYDTVVVLTVKDRQPHTWTNAELAEQRELFAALGADDTAKIVPVGDEEDETEA